MSQNYVDDLLEKWEEVYKRGLLSFWLLLLLNDRSVYPREVSDALAEISQGSISADDNSIYRALTRFENMGIVTSEFQGSDLGPPRKYYKLNEKGLVLLAEFIRRNILVFEYPTIKEKVQSVLVDANLERRSSYDSQ